MRLEEIIRNVDTGSALRRFIVTDDAGKRYLIKILEIFDIDVYKYLLTHKDPHIPIIFGYMLKNGKLIVVEDYIESVTLSEYVKERPLSMEMRIDILCRICDAASFLHKAKPMIIHRDIKPDNIIIDTYGRAFLTDYDAAKIYHEGFKRDTLLIGTAGSAAPEQYGFAQSDMRTDVYGIGKLIEFLFPASARPLWLDGIVKKATRLDPELRFESVALLKKSIIEKRIVKGLFPLPGFRDDNPLKIMGALPGYIFITLIYLSTIREGVIRMIEDFRKVGPGDSGSFLSVLVLYFLVFSMTNLYFFMCYDMFANWLGLYNWMPFLKKSWPLRQLFAALYIISIYFLITYVSLLGVFVIVLINLVALVGGIRLMIRKRKLDKIIDDNKTEEN